ncbi:MAG: HAD family hydrolase, partial [bacterium]
MPVRIIIFDLGNVIVFVNHMQICEEISGWGGSSEDIYEYIFLGGMEIKFDQGEINPFDFFENIKKRFNLNMGYEDFKRVWSGAFIQNKEIFPLIKALKPDYRLCLLSNTNPIHFEEIQRKISILSEFELFFLSFRLGVSKPNPSIFQKALVHLKAMPDECVYIDDIDVHVQAARKIGLNGIVYQDVP